MACGEFPDELIHAHVVTIHEGEGKSIAKQITVQETF